jgi:hypothetical protein
MKSKVTGKTLTLRQGGNLNGNGPVGFYGELKVLILVK